MEDSLLPNETRDRVPCVMYLFNKGRLYKIHGHLYRGVCFNARGVFVYKDLGYRSFVPDTPQYKGQQAIGVECDLGEIGHYKMCLLEDDDDLARKKFTDKMVGYIREHQAEIDRLRAQINVVRNTTFT